MDGQREGVEESEAGGGGVCGWMWKCLCLGGGIVSLSLWQGWDSHPTPLSLQNGYINFDKRRKVRGALWAGCWTSLTMSQEREGGEEKSGFLSLAPIA